MGESACSRSNNTHNVLPQVEMLQEEVAYATEEVERLTKVLDEQNSLLQASQKQAAWKDVTIKNLQQKVISVISFVIRLFKGP